MNTENQSYEKVNKWVKNSVSLKLGTIGLLVLLLLIPSSMIKSIIRERESMNFEATNEVSLKWANSQVLTGPILKIPLLFETQRKVKKAGSTKVEYETINWKDNLTILPEQLNITGEVEPKKLRRGIYEIVVYESYLKVSGFFKLNGEFDKTELKLIDWEHAFLTIGISDLRGIQNRVKVKVDDQTFEVKPGSNIPELIKSGITVNPDNLVGKEDQIINFEFSLDLQGSQNISFIPVGGTTDITLTSSWDSPSFDGNFLPDSREINDEGFTASWKVLQLNRNFPQSWIGSDSPFATDLDQSQFGANLILPLDDYQKSMRSAKYAAMTIVLTFLIFFLVEILNKKKIHPFQYTLVGLSLCLFYVLLVSISEHSNFNLAYTISTLSIVAMISLYSMSVLQMKKLVMTMVVVLFGIYGFLFVTLQLADYALLLGSIGLTLIMALTMYLTRNINWYNLEIKTE